MIPDMSDEGLVKQFGDVLFEIPELFEALRRFEIESRPTTKSGGFRMSVSGLGCKTRIRIGIPRGVE